jgi:DNA-binding response OmpR family regulator
MAHVLVVEDAPDALELATATLRSAGHTTSAATTAVEALRSVRARPPEVILLDLGLPDADGTDLCRELRGISDAYILMLTARDDEVDKVLGLKLGADDYVTKPYSPRELTARIEALLRRPRNAVAEPVDERHVGDLVVRPLSHDVLLDGRSLQLTRIEFAILDALTESPSRVLSREQLRSRVWGDDWFAGDHSLDVHMANLRRKIDANGVAHIRTVRGVGYRMAEELAEVTASGGRRGP